MTRSLLRALAVTLATATLAVAQDRSTDTTTLAPLVVTATRLPTPTSSLTATVTVLDGNQLRAEGITHLGDALRRVPGLALARTSSFGSQQALFLRGGQSNYVRLLVDGVPMNEPGGVLDLGRITLDQIERIEVVRGPASVLYGSEAVTGVIQLFTRRGDGQLRSHAEVGGGSFDTRRLSLGANGSVGSVGWSLSGDHHGTDGTLPFNNAYRNDGAVATLSAGSSEGTDAKLTLRYATSVYHYPTGSDGSVEDRNAERTEHRLVAGLDVGRRWSDRVSSRLQLSAMDLLPRTNDGADDASDTLGFYGYYARATVTRRIVDLRTTMQLGAGQFATVGAEYARDAERSRSVSLSEFGDFPDAFRASRENVALYVQGQGALGALDYTAGGRVDENSAFGRFNTVRLGFGLRVHPRVRLRSSVGTAFKAPSFFENFATGFTLGNRELRPEQSRSADLGVELALPNGGAVRTTLFAQRFEDLVQYTGAPAPGEPNYYNVAAANAGGVEFGATLPLPSGGTLALGHTWTDTRVVDAGFDTAPEANFVQGGRLLRRPAHVTTVQVARPVGGAHQLTLGVTRIGDREDRDFATFPATVVVLPAFVTIDAALEIAIPGRGARIQLRADNLADVRTEQIAGFESPGRVFYAGLKLQR